MTGKQIVLCSASPRRQLLLKEMGLLFDVMTKDLDESFPLHLKREEISCFLSEKKASAFKEKLMTDKTFITADTIVWFENKVLNKPADEKEAFSMLKQLSGNMHEVFTGVTVFDEHHSKTFFVKTDVYFNKFDDDAILSYIVNFRPFDKAGSYGAQECLPDEMDPISEDERTFLEQIGKPHLAQSIRHPLPAKNRLIAIRKIDGSYFNVVGLPIKELYSELEMF
jgi:septum formation protein